MSLAFDALHDGFIRGVIWDEFRDILQISVRLDDGRFAVLEFVEPKWWSFDNFEVDNILLDVQDTTTTPPDWLVDEIPPSTKTAFESGSVRLYSISSSTGMCGWVIALRAHATMVVPAAGQFRK